MEGVIDLIYYTFCYSSLSRKVIFAPVLSGVKQSLISESLTRTEKIFEFLLFLDYEVHESC